MAISGQNNIDIGGENQAAGSDTLYEAFTKIQQNFTTLFDGASSYDTFIGSPGIGISTNPSTGNVEIENTGVVSIIAGTGISLSSSNGNVVISSSGGSNAGGTVTSVALSSETLTISDSPIVSSGTINVELPYIPTGPAFAAGEYVAPTLTVDNYGRITEIANTVSIGTVTSVAITATGDGLQITNSPITSSGTIEIENTGVTAITAGNNISISNSTGNVTIDANFGDLGTVTRIDVTSNTLTITGSPVTTEGDITIDIPDDVEVAGNIVANTFTANSYIETVDFEVTGTATINAANITTLNANIGGYFDGIIGDNTPNAASFTDIEISGNANITSNVNVSDTLNIVGDDSAVRFLNSSGNSVSFVTPSVIEDSSFYVPDSPGTIYQVLGVTADASTQTLGWKTIPVQYLTITLRDGVSTVSAPPDVVLRKYTLETRTGALVQISLS
jgi:hypothetical protein